MTLRDRLTSASSIVPAFGLHWTALRGKKWCIRFRSFLHHLLPRSAAAYAGVRLLMFVVLIFMRLMIITLSACFLVAALLVEAPVLLGSFAAAVCLLLALDILIRVVAPGIKQGAPDVGFSNAVLAIDPLVKDEEGVVQKLLYILVSASGAAASLYIGLGS